jgi:hypothetical protein
MVVIFLTAQAQSKTRRRRGICCLDVDKLIITLGEDEDDDAN